MSSAKDPIKVSLIPGSSNEKSSGTPAHWKDAKGSLFQNPWPSYRDLAFMDAIGYSYKFFLSMPKIPSDVTTRIPSVRPTWGTTTSSGGPDNADKIKATWLGHACFLVELPVRQSTESPAPSRGARILFDPVFSDRCSPVQWFGPKRYTQLPCEIAEIPEVDAIVISHNHYDHLDADTIRAFSKRPNPPHLLAPLGNGEILRSLGVSNERIHCLDWWEGRRVEVEVGSSSSSKDGDKSKSATATVAFDVTCTPSQHQSARSIHDRFRTLWGSWVVQEVLPQSDSKSISTESDAKSQQEGMKVYFAGDTGYRTVQKGEDEDEVPFCPAFKEIGERWGSFDLALIPIGAYEPREFMSRFHCAPQDSVRIFKDIRAKKALGMHWGTWLLTMEDVTEPPRKLAEECKKLDIPDEDFGVCDLGETVFF
ncbi:Metallo-hydrolase/oxidoreductase [Fomitiporia mediterranea MF3/22]|uniref:Metallo-hydrolase/oxidoreductase n=1 Tax=Fomitiporia mediterranea (strain MF3/22) TaxID=694068 RepID=UPI0004408AD1|nr:Metallo-hydrolase/oxidoreductase [Fomitiporia mediterranea MF3/22]EJC99211.1 Metallo-hydrolase/oxidoreductase [Fomitiporia mediterranea MF3/22]